MSCVHRYLQMSLASEEALQLSDKSGFVETELMDNRNSEEKMNETKSPSDYKIESQSYERKPTGGIQEIAEKPFTVIHIDKFKTKAGEIMVIVDTEEKFENIEYKVDDQKTKGTVSRFFASPVELKKFFGDEGVIADVNDNGNKVRTMIEKISFNSEEIKRDSTLKGKTHYVFKKIPEKQGRLGV